MTDTATPAPWYAVLQTMAPSLNQSLVAIVAALVTLIGTLTTQWATSAPAPVPEVQVRQVETVKVAIDPAITAKLDHLEGRIERLIMQQEAIKRDYAEWGYALQAEVTARQIAKAKARKAATAASSPKAATTP
jgi:hypothetical protein